MQIDGRQLAQNILSQLHIRVEKLQQQKHIQPHLGIIVVGHDPATISYIKQKKKMGEQIGCIVSVYQYPETIIQKDLEKSVDFLQHEGSLHGLIIQLPLPSHIDSNAIISRVRADIDVDGFTDNSWFHEPIANAVIRILEEIFSIEQSQKLTSKNEFSKWLLSQHIIVIGKGKTGGQPIISILKEYNINPVIVDSKTENREKIIKAADILICAIGKEGVTIDSTMIKQDAILIGIGMHMGKDGKLHGDYKTEDIKDKASYFTPVPGGVGPVNAAMLLENVIHSAEKKVYG